MPFRYQSVGAYWYKSSVVEEVYSCFLNYLPFIQSFFAAAGFRPYSEATFITILDTFFHGLEYQLQIINWKNFQNVKVQNGFFLALTLGCVALVVPMSLSKRWAAASAKWKKISNNARTAAE